MLRFLFKKQYPVKLGRWNIIYDNEIIDKKINWANHDHCGSDLCDKHFISKKENDIKKENNMKKEKSKKKTNGEENDLYYKPFCL